MGRGLGLGFGSIGLGAGLLKAICSGFFSLGRFGLRGLGVSVWFYGPWNLEA